MKKNTACRWHSEDCPACNGKNPFSTDVCCPGAITLYYASGNILCPNCYDGYLRLDKNKRFSCEKCDFQTGYEIVLDYLLNLSLSEDSPE